MYQHKESCPTNKTQEYLSLKEKYFEGRMIKVYVNTMLTTLKFIFKTIVGN